MDGGKEEEGGRGRGRGRVERGGIEREVKLQSDVLRQRTKLMVLGVG
jgi:hypothetical protein